MFLSWSNEGNKLCLLFSVCYESVSALRTHRKRETFSVASTVVVRIKSLIISLFVDENYSRFHLFCFCFLKKILMQIVLNPNSYSVGKFYVGPTEEAECAEHCNYFVQNLVKVLVC